MFACTKKPVHSEEDLDLVIAFEPPMPLNYPQLVKKAVDRTKQIVGDDGIVGAWVPYGPFNNASHLIDLDELYMLFITEPEYYKKLMEFCTVRHNDYTKAILEAKPDVVHVGGNVPGGFLGKNTYDTYIAKYEKEYIEFCQKSGIPAMYHNCGQIMVLIESYKDLGVQIVEPFSPPPLGDTRLPEALDVIAGDYITVCGIDQVNLLQNGTVDQVVKATEVLVRTGLERGRGKFILQNADFLEYGTPIENIKAFVDTAKKIIEKSKT
jgi:uroporphyrinogen-III decarboxylase